MTYAEYVQRTWFDLSELLALAHGNLVTDAPGEMGRLPAPPLLMFDRVVEITRAGNRGRIVAEQDLQLDAWYFQAHFRGDPVQPGCLGVDAVWQLLGLFMSACDCLGAARALGVNEVEFFGQIRPYDRLVRYEVDVRRLTRFKERGVALVLADATVAVDGQIVYTIAGARCGAFPDIRYADYPFPSKNSRGGPMRPREGGSE
jgi:3-hydroxyacyl-[acyl-carrier protein] dehydratase / trans-2-decenoyl-[acyl-carrier protein] isomerase